MWWAPKARLSIQIIFSCKKLKMLCWNLSLGTWLQYFLEALAEETEIDEI